MTDIQKTNIDLMKIRIRGLFDVPTNLVYRVYESYKDEIIKMNLTPAEYETAIREISRGLGI